MKSVVMLGLLVFFAAGLRAQTASTPAVVEMRAGQSHAIAPSDSTSAETLFQKAEVLRKNDPPQIQEAVALYLRLLTMEGHPEVRRAQMELGNLVLDGKYSSGEDARGHAQNLEWARIITQELLGQQEYQLAVDYDAQVDGVPKDMNQWLRFCQRAAAYNIDLAQEFLGKALLQKEVPRSNPFEGYAWLRMSSDKRYANRQSVSSIDASLNEEQQHVADSYYYGLVETRKLYGAYYRVGDPLRDAALAKLASMDQDDPDVQLRLAYALEQQGTPESYKQAMDLYRTVRDHRERDIRLVLVKDYELGRSGLAVDPRMAKYWRTYVEKGYEAARPILRPNE